MDLIKTGKYIADKRKSLGLTQKQVAEKLGMSDKSVSKWERIYYEEGKDALYEERRGRASKMGNRKSRKTKTNVEKNEDLLAEVQRLRMENEYLKKLNALVQEREKSKKLIK